MQEFGTVRCTRLVLKSTVLSLSRAKSGSRRDACRVKGLKQLIFDEVTSSRREAVLFKQLHH